MDISAPIRAAMKAQDLSAEQLAEKAGLARSTVFNLLRGARCDSVTIGKLLAAGVRISGDRLKELLIDAATAA